MLRLAYQMNKSYDIVVLGGGHAGIEAALAAAKMGCTTALVTMDIEATGRMSCNPAIGGTAKGHLVREIDALGGAMGLIADKSAIQYKMLNRSKGPAIWSPRSQNDREQYSAAAKNMVLDQPNLDILQGSINLLHLENDAVAGVTTSDGQEISCRALIVCAGTFLNGAMYTGLQKTIGGRFGEEHSTGITETLLKYGFETGRLKTGTPPRVALKSIDFDACDLAPGDEDPQAFSFRSPKPDFEQVPCYVSYTNTKTHDIMREGFEESPMFTGRIKSAGPRYCPSIEDKIVRFADRDRHHLFLEPEGWDSDVVYVNGFSSSLPEEIQLRALRSVKGLENVEMTRPGYAVEYDFIPPHQLKLSLETKAIANLFLAGQVNGTSGYEEAAAQGLIAGINAVKKLRKEKPFILSRAEAYIGVLIDDLVNKGTEEPYRMFTSRAEYRLILRQDNADRRLMKYGHDLGLLPDSDYEAMRAREELITSLYEDIQKRTFTPAVVNPYLKSIGSTPISQNEHIFKMLRREEVRAKDMLGLDGLKKEASYQKALEDPHVIQQLEIQTKYSGYIERLHRDIEKFKQAEAFIIPEKFDYDKVNSFSNEGREKLKRVRPETLGQASRISGVSSADVSILMVYLKS
jgi:tRNA uridine 5-carboxymethylaminomethyl modification enzyme